MPKDNYPKKDARQRSKYQYGGMPLGFQGRVGEAEEYGEDIGAQEATRRLEQGLMEEDVKSPMRWEYHAEKAANERAEDYLDANRRMAEKLGVKKYKKGGKVKK